MDINSSTIAAIIAIIAGITWLVRLEGKATIAATKATDVETDFYKHAADNDVHQRSEDLDRRFDNIKSDLDKIEKTIENGFEKINTRIDRMLNK